MEARSIIVVFIFVFWITTFSIFIFRIVKYKKVWSHYRRTYRANVEFWSEEYRKSLEAYNAEFHPLKKQKLKIKATEARTRYARAIEDAEKRLSEIQNWNV